MKLIVGLGNPGKKYARVRHNLGFMVVEEYAKKYLPSKIVWRVESKFKSEIISLQKDIWLIKPLSYMNNSGMAVKLLTSYYKLPPAGLIVIHDELDLPLGKIKVRLGGSAAGHHGVESIINALGTDQFIRIRLGIGNLRTKSAEKNGQTISAEKFVLEPFMNKEHSKVKHMIKQTLKALDILLEKGLKAAQNQFNA